MRAGRGRGRAPSALLIAGLAGCARDPVLLGFWDIEEVSVDVGAGPVRQGDMGTLELAEGEATLIVRYRWAGEGFVPVSQPDTQRFTASTEGRADDLAGAYAQEGEVHVVELDTEPYVILDYTGSEARLEGEGVRPPDQLGQPVPEPTLATVTWLLRR